MISSVHSQALVQSFSMAHQGKNFQSEEERQLCLSLLQVLQDPIVGIDQKTRQLFGNTSLHITMTIGPLGSQRLTTLKSRIKVEHGQ